MGILSFITSTFVTHFLRDSRKWILEILLCSWSVREPFCHLSWSTWLCLPCLITWPFSKINLKRYPLITSVGFNGLCSYNFLPSCKTLTESVTDHQRIWLRAKDHQIWSSAQHINQSRAWEAKVIQSASDLVTIKLLLCVLITMQCLSLKDCNIAMGWMHYTIIKNYDEPLVSCTEQAGAPV